MKMLKRGMSRQEAESVLGLLHLRTNVGFVWKYVLSTNNSVLLTFQLDWDERKKSFGTNPTELLSATLDFQSVTSRLGRLRRWMPYPEFEATLGVRAPTGGGGSSSSMHLQYDFDDPDQAQENEHVLSASFSTPCVQLLALTRVLDDYASEDCLRTNGSLHSVQIDGQRFELPEKQKP